MRILLLLFTASLFLFACQKPDDHKQDDYKVIPIPLPTTPYDISGTNGELIIQLADTTWNAFTLYNDELVNVTYMNNDYLRWNYRYSLAWGTVGDGYFNYNSSTWTMIRNYTTNSYTDSSVFPYCAIRIPDTILLGSGQKLFIDSISNADTILLTSIRSIVIQQFSKPYSWQTRSIDLDTNSVINTPGQSATLTFSIFHHIYDTVNGARYIFIKEYDVTKNVYIK